MSNDLLNPEAPTPAGLMAFFQVKYRTAMEAQNKELRDECPPDETPLQIEVEFEMNKLRIFSNFVDDYLEKNPPSTVQAMDRAYGIKLVTGEAFVIGGATPQPRGSMQPSRSMHVTGSVAELAEAYGQGQGGDRNPMTPSGAPKGTVAAGEQGSQNLAEQQGSTALD